MLEILFYIFLGITSIVGTITIGLIIWAIVDPADPPPLTKENLYRPPSTGEYMGGRKRHRLDDDQEIFLQTKLLPFIASYHNDLAPSSGYAWEAYCNDRDNILQIVHDRVYDDNQRRMIQDWTGLYKTYKKVNI